MRVYVESDESKTAFPVIVVVRHEHGVLSWEMPMRIQDPDFSSYVHYTAVNRTICPYSHVNDNDNSNNEPLETNKTARISVSVSSASVSRVGFKMSLYVEKMYEVNMTTKGYNVSVNPGAPQYFKFVWPEADVDITTDMAIVSVDSNDTICMTVSVQNLTCPLNDLNSNVDFEGIYQTVDTKTGVSVRREKYPLGFHVMFVVKGTDEPCRLGFQKLTLTDSGHHKDDVDCHGPCRNKMVHFKISNKISQSEYYEATFGAFLLFCGAYLIVVLVSCVLCVAEMRQIPRIFRREETLQQNYNTLDNDTESNSAVTTTAPVNDDCEDRMSETSSLCSDEYDLVEDAETDKELYRTKHRLYLSDLARRCPEKSKSKSLVYQWNLITIATFYGLPVIQLVVTYQNVLNQTGNEDLCYYNFLCAHPWGLLSDFNHVFSNLGYVMLGGLFMMIVWRKEILYIRFLAEHPGWDKKYGVPQYFGLFYAMGFALVMEGFMSGCYHICPNHSNFQFDTAFMYTIAILSMLKIYQFRHPDLHANAYKSFGALAFVIFVGVLGVIDSNLYFWIFFTISYIVTVLLVTAQLYHRGQWGLDLGTPKRLWRWLHHDFVACRTAWGSEAGQRTLCGRLRCVWAAVRPHSLERFIFLVFWNMLNWLLAGYGAGVLAKDEGSDFASFLLGILIINLLLYTKFYLVMKLRHGERILVQPLFYIILSLLTWAGALYYFLSKSTSWVLPPAESRHLNMDCVLFNFYDNHDIWHFLSALSLFLSYMILLCLDDDLTNTPREKIPVF